MLISSLMEQAVVVTVGEVTCAAKLRSNYKSLSIFYHTFYTVRSDGERVAAS